MVIELQRKVWEELYLVTCFTGALLVIYHSLCPAYVNELLERVQHMYGTRNKYNSVQIKCRTIKYGINSFAYQGAKVWNELRQDFKVLPSIQDFKRAMASFNGRTCGCSHCILCVLRQM